MSHKNIQGSVSKQWVSALREDTSSYNLANSKDIRNIHKISRLWQIVCKDISVKDYSGISVLEIGCGGAKHLVNLALNGFNCAGIDVSKEVLSRASDFISQVEKFYNKTLNITLIHGDVLKNKIVKKYELVFSIGVAEHFIDRTERLRFLKLQASYCLDNGNVVTVVPNGIHLLRDKMKGLGWGGYNIPEIDYSPDLLRKELLNSGLNKVIVKPYSIGGIFLIIPGNNFLRLFYKFLYLLIQIIPRQLIPMFFQYLTASSLVGVGKK